MDHRLTNSVVFIKHLNPDWHPSQSYDLANIFLNPKLHPSTWLMFTSDEHKQRQRQRRSYRIIWPISFSIPSCTHLVNVHIRCFVPQQQQQLITGSTGTLSLSLSFGDKSTNTNTLKNANTSNNTNTAQSREQKQTICCSLNREAQPVLYAWNPFLFYC